MANDLVNFPAPGDEWEGMPDGPGMYVLAVLPRWLGPDICTTGSAISILRPAGTLLTPVQPLWPTEESREYDARMIEEAARLFEEGGEMLKASVMRAQFPATDLSVEVLHATHMGSMRHTLKSKETGDYWQADWDDLTPCGILLMNQVNTCFGRSPLLLTFLGDEEEGE